MKTVWATNRCPTYQEGQPIEAPESIARHLVEKGYATESKPVKKRKEEGFKTKEAE